jgi:hypothetical protein
MVIGSGHIRTPEHPARISNQRCLMALNGVVAVILGGRMTHAYSKAVLALAGIGLLASAPLVAQRPQSCTLRDLKGAYGFTVKTTNSISVNYILTGRFDADGSGSFSGAGHENVNFTAGETTFTGTYTINSDCTGDALFQYAAGQQAHLFFVIVEDGNELIILDNDTGVMEAGYAKRQSLNKERE